MSEINIRVEPGQQIEIDGTRYETTGEYRRPMEGDHWLGCDGESVFTEHQVFGQPRLILRPLTFRKVPTDQDAAVWPRRKCWVRDWEYEQWNEATLLAVVDDKDNRFRAICDSHPLVDTPWRHCEIEVQE